MKTERRMFGSSGGMTGCDGKENLSDVKNVTTRLAWDSLKDHKEIVESKELM